MYPKAVKNWVAELMTASTHFPGTYFISGGASIAPHSSSFTLQAQKVIGYIGILTLNPDNGFNNLIRLIRQVKDSFSRYSDLVFIRLGKLATYLYQSKLFLGNRLEAYLPKTLAGLLFGMVFGGAQTIDDSLESSFKITGMLHVVSASGYNVGLVRGISEIICRRFWAPRKASFLTIGLIFIYVYLADVTPSVIRASVMISLQIISTTYLHRQFNGLWLLAITAASMVLFNASYLENLSFQFSVLACFGILIWSSIFNRQSMYDLSSGEHGLFKFTQVFKDAFWLTLAAQSFSWGIQIATFGELSLVSLVANPAAIWITPLLTLGTIAFLVASLVLSQIVVVREFGLPLLALPLLGMSRLFIWIITFFGQWEWGVLTFSPQPRWFPYIWCVSVFCLALLIKRWRRTRKATWYVT